MTWIDILIVCTLALSVVVGLLRGLVFELMSLVGWIVAYIGAGWLSPFIAPYIPVGTIENLGTIGASANHAGAFAAAFVMVLLVWSIISRLVRLLLHATPLSVVDRLLGAVFGSARGVLAVLVIITILGLTPMARSPAWHASVLTPWFKLVLQELKPVLPAQLSQRLPA
jgi:membrane protein required for colicin V production